MILWRIYLTIMSQKKNKKTDEASVATAIKGYLSNKRSILDPYEKLRPKKKKEVPWYLKRQEDIKSMVNDNFSLLKKKFINEEPLKTPKVKGKTLSYEDVLLNLKKQVEAAKKEYEERPDFGTKTKLKDLTNELNDMKIAYKLGGENWKEYLLDPEKKQEIENIRKRKEEESKVLKSDPKLVLSAKKIIDQYNNPEIWKTIKNSGRANQALQYLRDYTGGVLKPGNQSRVESWLNNVLLDKFKGNIASYADSQEKDIPLGVKTVAPKPTVKGVKSRSAIPGGQFPGAGMPDPDDPRMKALATAMKDRRKLKMPKRESFDITLESMFEGFENSYELETDEKEKEWEKGDVPAKKDWTKELSLESLVPNKK